MTIHPGSHASVRCCLVVRAPGTMGSGVTLILAPVCSRQYNDANASSVSEQIQIHPDRSPLGFLPFPSLLSPGQTLLKTFLKSYEGLGSYCKHLMQPPTTVIISGKRKGGLASENGGSVLWAIPGLGVEPGLPRKCLLILVLSISLAEGLPLRGGPVWSTADVR